MADESPRDGQEWQFRLRLLEEKIIRLDTLVNRLLVDTENEKGTRGRNSERLDERLALRSTEFNSRFIKLEDGQMSIRLWIAGATSIILFVMFLMELYFSTGRHVVP